MQTLEEASTEPPGPPAAGQPTTPPSRSIEEQTLDSREGEWERKMLNADTSGGEESEEPGVPSPLLAPATDPVSLARLRLYNAYRWSVQPEEYRVRWEGHGNHLSQQVARLEHDPASADVTVATKGASIPSHRIVLAAASAFFRAVLQGVPAGQHPVIVVRGADPRHLRHVVSFCYSGSLRIPHQDVSEVLKLAEDLEISGLQKMSTQKEEAASPLSASPRSSVPRASPLGPLSPNMFTFNHSPATPTLHTRLDGFSGPKRLGGPLNQQDTQSRKRCKVEPLASGEEGELLATSPHSTPPTSAPPYLTGHASNTHFFRSHHLSPPNSAPPQAARDHSAPHHLPHPSSPSSHTVRSSSVSVVPPSRLLQPLHSPPPAHSSNPGSPHQESPSPTANDNLSLPQTPTATKEPLTPTTPTTPSTKSESGTRGPGSTSSGSRVLLWRFLLDLLHNPHYTPIYIRWLDRPAGIFRIMESDMVAQLWGRARKNTNMNYEKMSRGMRTYYKRGILFHIDGTKLIYKFNTSDAEIQQRMRYYDLTLKSELPSTDQAGSSFLVSPNLSSLSGLSNLNCLPMTSTASMESLYSPLLRDMPSLHPSLLYDPYLSLFRPSKRELC
nr:ETS translocation variant 5-like isoform X2 [Procambarus clarkii]